MDALQNVRVSKIDSWYATTPQDIITANHQRLHDLIKGKGITIIALTLFKQPGVKQDTLVGHQTVPTNWPVLNNICDGRTLKQLAYQIILLHYPGNTDQGASLLVAKSGFQMDVGVCEIKYDPKSGFFNELST